jgi:hypothetical protein
MNWEMISAVGQMLGAVGIIPSEETSHVGRNGNDQNPKPASQTLRLDTQLLKNI